jgi:sialate O-acetylesterase
VPNPAAVRQVFSGTPEGRNRYNEEELPASPFRTDDWE